MEQHMSNQPHALHIYNKQGKKEKIDILIVGKHRYTWWKAVDNEVGRLANGIGNGLKFTNTINFIQK